ncbi:MAG: hypothetical protein KDA76_01320 [Planctomycetaceae bacterium]|nr:hypothetical protein [Planctomycetaceae bacterium]
MTTTVLDTTIKGGVAYSLGEFERRTGLKRTALRMARQAGLKVIRVHGRAFVRGEDWLAYLDAAATRDQDDTATAEK